MELLQLLKENTDANVLEVEAAMKEGRYVDDDFQAEHQKSFGVLAGPQGVESTEPNRLLTITHKATGTVRVFDIGGNPSWEEELKQAFRDKGFGR